MKNINSLVDIIYNVHQHLQKYAVSSVNRSLTIRNWLIGYYIVEYEQNGQDRAKYGTKIIAELAGKLKNIKGMDERSLRNFRLFYQRYPQIGNYIQQTSIWGSVTPKLITPEKWGSLTPEFRDTPDRIPAKKIVNNLSYTHLEQLIRIEDDLKRTFYEIEAIKGTRSVRELN